MPCLTPFLRQIHEYTGSYTAWGRLHVFVNPELLAQGTAVSNFSKPDAVVLGASTCSSAHSEAYYNLKSLYSTWVPKERILTMSASSAALFKLANNALLAQQLSSMNALASICTAFNTKRQEWVAKRLMAEGKSTRPGSSSDSTSFKSTRDINSTSCSETSPSSFRPGAANVTDVIEALSRNTRLSRSGTAYFQPGLGFGGLCLRKSALLLANIAERLGLPRVYTDQFYQTCRLNTDHLEYFVQTVLNACDHRLDNKNFAVVGLTFKTGTDDVRGSIAQALILRLLKEGAHAIDVYDPLVTPAAFRSCFVEEETGLDLPVTLRRDLQRTCMFASCVIIVNVYPQLTPQDSNEYCRLWTDISASLQHPRIIFDTRNCLDDSILQQCEGEPVQVVRMGGMGQHQDQEDQDQEQGQLKDDSSATAAETP